MNIIENSFLKIFMCMCISVEAERETNYAFLNIFYFLKVKKLIKIITKLLTI